MSKKRVGVLISGNGSNLQALIDACASPFFPAEIAVVISSNAEAYGLNRAHKVGIPAHIISHKAYASREEYDRAINLLLRTHLVDIVCLAGFMRMLSDEFVTHWHDKMLNIHPSLLPSFKGTYAVCDALAAGVKITGCTVHFVRAEMDAGPIVMQAAVAIEENDTPETLALRIHAQEHICYPQSLKLLAEEKLAVVEEKVRVTK